jgi:thioredoxin family protein
MKSAVALMVLALSVAPGASFTDIDFYGLLKKGIGYGDFVERATARRDEWKRNTERAQLGPGVVDRARQLAHPWYILVVAEPSCSDSVNTLPYIAKLVESVPERFDLLIVDSTVGRTVMETYRTPDGRAATPTVVLLRKDWQGMRTWIERPAALRAWLDEQPKDFTADQLRSGKASWYATDSGKSALNELLTLMEQP